MGSSYGLTVAYLRLSVDKKDGTLEHSASIYNQLAQIKTYAEQIGLNVDKEYIDDGYSGINFDRPGFEQLKEDIDKGIIGTIITKDMSRLGREFIETAYYVSEYFPRNNIRYIAINDGYDSADPNNEYLQMLVGIKSIINDRVVKDSSTKRKATAITQTNSGNYIGFTAPYGYVIKKENNKRTLEIDEVSSKIVQRIFMEKAEGKSRDEIATGLNNDKIVPPFVYKNMTESKGKYYSLIWDAGIIYRILKNKTYMGYLIVRKSTHDDYKDKKRKYIPIEQREIKKGIFPAIISEDLWKKAHSQMKQGKSVSRHKYHYKGIYDGLIYCGECGRKMNPYGVTKENGNVKYFFACNKIEHKDKCKNRTIYDGRIENIVKNALDDLIQNFVDDEYIINKSTKDVMTKERNNEKISLIKQNIEIHKTNIKKLFLDKTKGKISLDEFIKKKNEENLFIEQNTKTLEELLKNKEVVNRKQELKNKYKKFIDGDILNKDSINELIERIDVYKDNTVKITFKFDIGKPKKIKLF